MKMEKIPFSGRIAKCVIRTEGDLREIDEFPHLTSAHAETTGK